MRTLPRTVTLFVALQDAPSAEDDPARGEVRALDPRVHQHVLAVDFLAHVLHEFGQRDVGAVDGADDRIENLDRVVRGHARGHPDRDADGAVDHQVRELARQHGGLDA
jgi:hypothetical protein